MKRPFLSFGPNPQVQAQLHQIIKGVTDAENAFNLLRDDENAASKFAAAKWPKCRPCLTGQFKAFIDQLPEPKFSAEQAEAEMTKAFGGDAWKDFFVCSLNMHPAWSRARLAAAWISRAPQINAALAAEKTKATQPQKSPAAQPAAVRPATAAKSPSTAAATPPAKPLFGLERAIEANRRSTARKP